MPAIPNNAPVPLLRDVMDAVLQVYPHLTKADFVSPARRRAIARPRQVVKPVEDARGLFCTEECRDRHLADKSARQAAEEAARAAIEARLLDKIPGVTIAGQTHIYVVKRDGLYVPQQCRVAFDFPGSKIGPAHFGHNEVGEEPGVTVCAGDLAAWEAWRASLGKAVS